LRTDNKIYAQIFTPITFENTTVANECFLNFALSMKTVARKNFCERLIVRIAFLTCVKIIEVFSADL